MLPGQFSKQNALHDLTTKSPPGQQLMIPASHILSLIGAHLTESGLHQTCASLHREAGVGLAGTSHAATLWTVWANEGNWGRILESLQRMDMQRMRSRRELLGHVVEMTILELADRAEWDVAYALFRSAQRDLEEIPTTAGSNISRELDQKLAALASSRQNNDPNAPLPPDYYGTGGTTKQQRREMIGQQLLQLIPEQPKGRLVALLQQAVKWQTYTGSLPQVRIEMEDESGQEVTAVASSKKTRKRKEFDIALGEVDTCFRDTISSKKHIVESVPSFPYSDIKFGKKGTPECAIFLPDGSGLVTGSSDGLIEIWDASQKYSELRLDLPYQEQDNLLGHENAAVTSVDVSNDGTLLASGASDGYVNVWRLDNGKCLRRFQVTSSMVSLVKLSPDGGRLLAASYDGICREFGLKTSRMLQEFRGHSSYITSGHYVTVPSLNDDDDNDDGDENSLALIIVTGSGDGTVRIWNGRTSEVIRVLRPSSVATSAIVVDTQQMLSDCPAIVTVVPLHTPPNSMIIVPRTTEACLVNYHGYVLKRFRLDKRKDASFLAATVSSTNRTLFVVSDDGVCSIFDVASGDLRKTIDDFGYESSRSSDKDKPVEISAVIAHPHKNILAAFSNDKNQKKGRLVLWK